MPNDDDQCEDVSERQGLGPRPSEIQCVVLWCSGYHVCLTRRRSPVRNWAEPCVVAVRVEGEAASFAAPTAPSSRPLLPVAFSIAPTAFCVSILNLSSIFTLPFPSLTPTATTAAY